MDCLYWGLGAEQTDKAETAGDAFQGEGTERLDFRTDAFETSDSGSDRFGFCSRRVKIGQRKRPSEPAEPDESRRETKGKQIGSRGESGKGAVSRCSICCWTELELPLEVEGWACCVSGVFWQSDASVPRETTRFFGSKSPFRLFKDNRTSYDGSMAA